MASSSHISHSLTCVTCWRSSSAVQRLTDNIYAQAIARAYVLIPDELHRFIQVDFLTGTDPIFAGLHHHENTVDGRSYRNTAHCCYGYSLRDLPISRRKTTIVLPLRIDARSSTVVHELGHALDESLGFAFDSGPTSWYSYNNRYEAFAEAFTSWVIPPYGDQDRPTSEFLNCLVLSERGA